MPLFSVPSNPAAGRALNNVVRRLNDPKAVGGSDDFCTMPKGLDSRIHDNAGVIILLFTLLVDGGAHPRPSSVGQKTCTVNGIGLEKAFRIAWDVTIPQPFTIRLFCYVYIGLWLHCLIDCCDHGLIAQSNPCHLSRSPTPGKGYLDLKR